MLPDNNKRWIIDNLYNEAIATMLNIYLRVGELHNVNQKSVHKQYEK